ncbi:unnamed protein product [Closterium sp. NIES-53]
MASPTVLTFDAEGRAVDFDMWVDDLQLFLQCDSRDGVSIFYHTSGVSTAPAATADSTVRSHWTTRDAVALARYSSLATAALSRLMLPYLFPVLAAFATVADLITHLRTSDARFRAALPTEDHFLSLCPTELTVDLLEERLAAAEKSILAVGASRGDRRTPFFEGCSLVPLLPSVASAAAVDLVGTEEVGAASALSGRHCNSKGKGSKGGGGDGGGGGGGRGGGVGGGAGGAASGGFSGGGGGGGGSGGGGGGSDSGGGGSGSGGGGGGGGVAGRGAAAQRGGSGGSQRQQQPRSRETPSPQQLREWYAGRGRSGGAGPCTYILRTGGRRGETCGLPHTAHRCFGRLTDAWRAQFPDILELPRWGDMLRQNVAIFDLDFDAILAAMYAVTDSAEGDCYLSVPPDLGIEAAALGASASAAPGNGESAAPGAGDTTLMSLSRHVAVSLADPSGGPVVAHSSTVLPCPAAPSGLLSGLHLPSFSTNLVSGADLQDAWVDQFTPGGQRLTHCTCSRTGRHLATLTRRLGSSLYTLTTASPPVTASGQVAASSQVFAAASRSSPEFAPCSSRPLSHETLLCLTLHVASGSLHEEIWLRRPPGFTGSFPAGTQWSLRRLVYGLRQAPRQWHDTLRTTLVALGFAPSTADPSLFLRTDTTLPPFYVLVYVDDLVFATADTEPLARVKSELQKRHTCIDLGPSALRLHILLATVHSSAYRALALSSTFGRVPRYVAPGRHRKVHWDAAKRVLRYLCSTSGMGLVLGGRARVVLTGHADASWVDDLAMQRSSQGYTFSLGSGSVSWRSTRSSSILCSTCEAEIYAGAMAAQELRWLT